MPELDLVELERDITENYNGGFTLPDYGQKVMRPYQHQAIEALAIARDEGLKVPLIAIPTGSGKTFTFSKAKQMLGFERMLIINHRQELVIQSAITAALVNPGQKVGIEMAQKRADLDCSIVVACVPTLSRIECKRMQKWKANPFDLVHIDEAHHSLAHSWLEVLQQLKVGHKDGPFTVGWTATPMRGDGKPMANVFDKVVFERTIKQLISEGEKDLVTGPYLVRVRAGRVYTNVDISRVKVVAGEFNKDELATTINIDPRNSIIISAIEDHAKDRNCILVFCANRNHAIAFTKQLRDAGHDANYVFGNSTPQERYERIRDFKEGRLRIMVGVDVFTEGFDNPIIDCVVMASPDLSTLRYMQKMGRGTRPAPWSGKKDLLVLDAVDNTGRHTIRTANEVFGVREMNPLFEDLTVLEEELEEAVEAEIEIRADDTIDDIHRRMDLEEQLAQGTVKVKTEFDAVDVFRNLAVPSNVEEHSMFPWHRVGNHRYAMENDRGNLVFFWRDGVGTWRVQGNGEQAQGPTDLDHTDTYTPFKWADKIAKRHFGFVTTKDGFVFPAWKQALLDAAWRRKKPSDKQLSTLKRMGFEILPPKLSRGAALDLITSIKIHERIAKSKARKKALQAPQNVR